MRVLLSRQKMMSSTVAVKYLTLALGAASVLLTALPAEAEDGRKLTKKERAAMALSPAQVALSVSVKGTEVLDPVVWVSTQPFLAQKYRSDKFFRAMIDKQTGRVTYQIYLVSVDSSANRLTRMTYSVDGVLKSATISRINFDVSCGRYGCTYVEDFILEIPRDHLQALACPEPQGVWKARLFGDTVDGTDANFLCNETAGFLLTVDRELTFLRVGE